MKLGQKYKNIFVGFLVQTKTLKFAFEINWPLGISRRGQWDELTLNWTKNVNILASQLENVCVKKYYVASVYPKVSRQLFLNTDIVKFSMQMTYKFKHLRTKTPASNSCMVISRLLRMECWKIAPKSISKQAYSQAKPSLKIGTANAICWNSLGLF